MKTILRLLMRVRIAYLAHRYRTTLRERQSWARRVNAAADALREARKFEASCGGELNLLG